MLIAVFAILFRLPFLIPILIVWGLSLIPSKIWRWLFNILGILLLLALLFSLVSYLFSSSNNSYHPEPNPISPPVKVPFVDTIGEQDSALIKNDTVIMHHVTWNDYDGNTYASWLKVRKMDSLSSSVFKQSLNTNGDNAFSNYSKMLSSLSQHDASKLDLIYKALDSIKNQKAISYLNFPKVVVSMVQRIPYVLVIPTACDPNTMSGASEDGVACDGNQSFGINAPIEFMSNMKGDCDTRTLLLYTILSHYDYDVAIFSSDIFRHSLLGINLPYAGTNYSVNGKSYVLWETTSMGFAPGILNPSIAILDYWYLSLKNK